MKLSLKQADVLYIENFYLPDEADKIFDELSKNIVWIKKEFEGRKTALYGTCDEYRYALNIGHPINWNTNNVIKNIAQKVSNYTNVTYDVCLANYYADGNDKFNFHADKEEIGKTSPICSLSFGAPRKFYFRSIDKSLYNGIRVPNEEESIRLAHGSMLVIPSICHEHYLHALPRDKTIKTPRINLTFRKTTEI